MLGLSIFKFQLDGLEGHTIRRKRPKPNHFRIFTFSIASLKKKSFMWAPNGGMIDWIEKVSGFFFLSFDQFPLTFCALQN